MSQTKAEDCCQVVDVIAGEVPAEGHRMEALIKSPSLDLRRIQLAKGGEVPTHGVAGEITVQCLKGRVAFTAGEKTHDLTAGKLIHLAPGVPHSLVGTEASVVLVTRILCGV